MKYYLGVDNGKEGAVVVVNEEGRLVNALKMPAKGGFYDGTIIVPFIDQYPIERACIEGVYQGFVNAVKSLSWCLGYFSGIFTCKEIPFTVVRPQAWQKAMLGSVKKGMTKEASLAYAKRTAPYYEWGKDDGLADAYALANYARLYT